MNKVLKVTAQIVGALITLYIILMVALFVFVQTKDFKPIITKAFYKETGQQLRIDGKIKLSLFPWPGIKASNIVLENPKNFSTPSSVKYLAKIGKLDVTVQIADLFHGKIEPKNIFIDKLDFNFITSQTGTTNVSHLLKMKSTKKNTKSTKNQTTQSSSTPTPTPSTQNSSSLKATSFPVLVISNSSIHFINLQTNKRTDVTHLELNSPESQNPMKRSAMINCQINHNNPDTVVDISAKTDVTFHPNHQAMDFNHIRVISKWLQVKQVFNRPIMLILHGRVFVQNNNFKATMNGNFGGDKKTLLLVAQRQDGAISTQLTLKDLSVATLAEILTGKKWIQGTMNAKTSLSTKGETFTKWLDNLSGNGSFKVTDGKIHGLDMLLIVSKTLSNLLSEKKQWVTDKGSTTAFQVISADFSISSGILTTNNFLLTSEKLKATGKGSVNLPNTTIDARLLTTYIDNPKWQLPLMIKGNLEKPKVQPDTAAIAKEILKEKFKNDIGNTLDKMKKELKGLFH